MANLIRLKRASGSDPAASDLVSGEPAVRTDTGELFFKKDDGSVAKVSGAGGGPDFKYLALRNAANNGAASYPNADFTLVTSGTTTALTPTAANTLLVSVNGVIQKPNTGTSTPSSGFALSGSTIKFGANISAAPDFILYQESGGIGEPSDETVGEDKLKVSNSPVNGYFLSAQSGNTGGLTWAAPVATSCTGNSATATALATARAINGVNFDGTAAITVTAAAGTLSGNTLNSSVTASSLTSLGDLAGLTVDGDATFTGANYNVLWDKSDNALEFADNAVAAFGAGSDLQFFHNGSSSVIRDNGSGALTIQNANSEVNIYNTTDNEYLARFTNGGSVDLYYDGSKKLETKSDGIDVTGEVQCDSLDVDGGFNIDGSQITYDPTSNIMKFTDNAKLYFGSGNDFRIYHDASNSYIQDAGTGDLIVKTNIFRVRGTNDEAIITGAENGNVALYYDNVKKFETKAGGVQVHGNLMLDSDNDKAIFGAGNDLQIYHDGTSSLIKSPSHPIAHYSNTRHHFLNGDGSEVMAVFVANGACELYHNASKKFETTSTGITASGTEHKFSSGTSGDCKLIIEADTDNNDENDNPLLIFRQDGGLDLSVIGMGLTTTASDNLLTIANSVTNGGITFATGTGAGYTNAVERLRIETGGALTFRASTRAGNTNSIVNSNNNSIDINYTEYFYLRRGNSAETLRADNNGDVAIGTTNTIHRLTVQNASGTQVVGQFLAGSTSYNTTVLQAACSRNTTNGSYVHFKCSINGVADKFRVLDNGNCANTNNSFSALSDETLKENIVDAGSQWNDIKNIRVRKFNFKEGVDPEKPTLLGVIAQEAETVCPNLVESTVQMQEGVEQEYKSFKYSVLYMKAIKALQEAQTRIETLETKVAALEAG